MKKGFTLIELLGVIILLGVLTLIIYPIVDSSIKQSRERALEQTINGIVDAAKIYGKQNKLSYDGYGALTLIDLKEAGVLENSDIIDPTTKSPMEGCVIYRWNDEDNQFHYDYDYECSPGTPTSCFTFNDSTGEITGYDKSCGTKVVIPAKIRGKNVIGIADSAFVASYYPTPVSNELFQNSKEYLNTMENTSFHHDEMTNIDVSIEGQTPVGIPLDIVDFSNAIYLQYIGEAAFANCGLQSVEFGSINNLVSIRDYAFADNNLTSIVIPKSVEYLSGFSENLLSEIVIPESVKTIGKEAFERNRIFNLVIPNSVVSIGSEAFQDNQITSLSIPEGVSEILYGTFLSNQIQTLVLPSSIQYIDNDAFAYNQLTELDLSHLTRLTSIYGFDNNNLTSVLLPNSLTYIGAYAFYNNEISNIAIPTSVVTIEINAFGYNQFSGTLDLSYLVNLKNLSGFTNNKITSVIFPNNIETISNNSNLLGAFSNNLITNIVIPEGVKTIGNYAFYTNKIETITLPNSLIEIGRSAFSYNQYSTITIPNNVISIGQYAFYKSSYSNRKLTSIMNQTGKTFDWGKIVNGSSSTTSYNFVTGTITNSYGNVTVNAH